MYPTARAQRWHSRLVFGIRKVTVTVTIRAVVQVGIL